MFFEQDKAGSNAFARFCPRMAEVGDAVRLPPLPVHVAQRAEEDEPAGEKKQRDAPPVPAHRGVRQSYAPDHRKFERGAQQVNACGQAQQADFRPFRQPQAEPGEAP